MIKALSKLFDSNEKQLKQIQPIIDEIESLEEYMSGLSDEELVEKTNELRKKVGYKDGAGVVELTPTEKEIQHKKLMEILPEAFAIVRESASRNTQHRHFGVQLMAGYVLSTNKIAELFTGEGKTNSANLALYLYGLTGRGAHLITVNDYLARRDGEWNGHVLAPLGISVAIVNNHKQFKFISDEEAIEIKGEEAVEAIKERDEAARQVGRLKLDLMNGVNLVEIPKKEAYECDVVFGTNNEFGFDYLRDNMARKLEDRVQRPLHYAIIDEADSILIDEARTPLIISQNAQASNDMYSQFAKIVRSLDDERDYTIDEKARSVAINESGIEKVEKLLGVDNVYEDAQSAYHLENALKAKELFHLDDEYIVREGEVIIVDDFTGRAMPGRRYSEGLHQAIEAKEGVEVKRESRTLATITLQNYFRLYDFLAGMTATALTEAEEFANIYSLDVIVVPTNKPVVRIDEVDKVFRTQEGKFAAIVEDIKEKYEVGQPVLVGTASVERSEYLSALLKKDGIPHQVLNAKYHEKEAKIVQEAGLKGQITIATNMAGRGTDIALGDGVKELGGLYVIGSERHESRRIDNQLRGRSGRQGDPGCSVFYVSFEDELMRRFGGDRMKGIMDRAGMDDDMPISIGILGKTIENAQKRVESYNFDIRKRLVEYDDVLNQQREIIYGLRKQILTSLDSDKSNKGFGIGTDEKVNLSPDNFKDLNITQVLNGLDLYSIQEEDTWDIDELGKYEGINKSINHFILKRVVSYVRFLVASQLRDDMKMDDSEERKTLAQMESLLTEELMERVVNLMGYDKFIDFAKAFDQESDLAQKEDLLLKASIVGFISHVSTVGEAPMRELSRVLILQSIDNEWMGHLDFMGDLREGVGMRSVAQRDPLVEYKNEGFSLFEEMFSRIDEGIVNRFFKVRVVTQRTEAPQERGEAIHQETDAITTEARKVGGEDNRPGNTSGQKTVVRKDEKIGRNDSCPCGSGKKYKKCHLNKPIETDEEKKAFELYLKDKQAWKKEYEV
jgi:preprotein translocase subunit SecA